MVLSILIELLSYRIIEMWDSDIDAAILQSNGGIAPDEWSEERTAAAMDYFFNQDGNHEGEAAAPFQDILPNIGEDFPPVATAAAATTPIPSESQKLEIPSMTDIEAMRDFIPAEEYQRLSTLRRIRDSTKRGRETALRAEQDAAFQASLEADRLKEIEKEKKEREARERQELEAREELERPEREAREARERRDFLRAKRCQHFSRMGV